MQILCINTHKRCGVLINYSILFSILNIFTKNYSFFIFKQLQIKSESESSTIAAPKKLTSSEWEKLMQYVVAMNEIIDSCPSTATVSRPKRIHKCPP